MEEKNDIDLFKETYNASYLQGLPEDKIQEVKQSVNPTLQKLIDNLSIIKTYNTVQYIEGPVEFYKLKLVTGSKSFYIFGEYHNDPTGHCLPFDSIPFADYIRRLAEETPSFFDLYIETPMVRYTKPEQRETKNEEDLKHYDIILGSPTATIQASIESMLMDRSKNFDYFFNTYKKSYPVLRDKLVLRSMRMSENFLDCFNPSTRISNQLCQLMRIHNVDARFSWLSENITDEYYLTVASIILLDIGKFYRLNDIPLRIDLIRRLGTRAVEIISSVFDFTSNQIDVDKIFDILLTNTYIKKELEKVEKQMKEKIINFFKLKIMIKSSSPSLVSNLSEFILCLTLQKPIRIIDNYFKITAIFFLDITTYAMDIYCLCRIFKKYNVQSAFQPVESKNIIIYTGNNHSKIYREFLMHIGAEETYHYENPNRKNCVLITKFTILEQSHIKAVKDLVSRLKLESKNKLKSGEINQSTFDNLFIMFNEISEGLKNSLNNRLPTEEEMIEGLLQFQEQVKIVYSYVLQNGVMPQQQEQEYSNDIFY